MAGVPSHVLFGSRKTHKQVHDLAEDKGEGKDGEERGGGEEGEVKDRDSPLVVLFCLVTVTHIFFYCRDPTWANLTAMNYHYYTQPLPSPVSHFMHNQPQWLHKIETLGMSRDCFVL